MKRRLSRLFAQARERLRDERGQGMTEYILVAMLAMIPLIVLLVPTMKALAVYLRGIYSFIGVPIP